MHPNPEPPTFPRYSPCPSYHRLTSGIFEKPPNLSLPPEISLRSHQNGTVSQTVVPLPFGPIFPLLWKENLRAFPLSLGS